MWFWIWCGLVVFALVCAFLAWRRLWLQAKRTLHTAGDLGQAFESMAAKIEELDRNPTGPAPRPVDVFADKRDLAELVASRRRRGRERRDARFVANAPRYEAWRNIDL